MSDWEDDFSEWPFSRRRRGAFPFFTPDKWFEQFDEMFERMFKEMTRDIPKDAMTERKLPDGSTVRQYGPYIYGYSMTMGPDGKPVVREFGNVKPSRRRGMFGLPEAKLEPSDTREPLVDVVEDAENVKVVGELPGVEKKDIQMKCAEDLLTISVNTPSRKYHKEVQLPTTVDPDTSKATYNNGVLEVTLRKTKPRPRGKEIRIE
jgi:HSP20 family protein